MALTLSTGNILDLVMDAFKTRVPFLMDAFTTDFGRDEAAFNQDVIARISSLPTVRDYDSTSGYKANAADSESLLTDVKVNINQHKHVPVKLDFLTAEKSTRNRILDQVTGDAGYVLAKSMADYCLGLVLSTNFSQSSVFTNANSDLDMLINVRSDLNGVGARPNNRFGIVSSGVMDYLAADSRIASRDYHGQMIGAEAYGVLRNIQGFENIWEYPDMPDNSENLSAFFGTPESIVLATRVPKNAEEIAKAAGIPSIAAVETMTDPDTGLTLMGIKWMEQGTMDIYVTVAVMYGAVGGNQAGATGALTDYAGHRVTTA